MAEEKKFPNAKSDLERYNLLKGSADRVYRQNIDIPLTSKQIVEISTDLGVVQTTVTEMNEEIKYLKKEKKKQTAQIFKNLQTLAKGSNTEDCELFDFRDYTNNRVNTYNKDGDLIRGRKMLPEERQTTIFTEGLKEGTND